MSTVNLKFYTVGDKGTVKRTPNYDPEAAVEMLYKSMKGLGTDEDAIIDVVATHTFHQRQELKKLYKEKYSKDLVKELDSELSFSFSKTVLALMMRPEQYIIDCIHQAISKSRAARLLKQLQRIYKKGLGSDEYLLISLICPRSNEELEAIKILYKKTYDKEIEDDIGADLGNDLRSLILDILSCGRESGPVVLAKVHEDADNLHGASLVPVGELCGTKERVLQQILNSRSYEHLRSLIPAYEELSSRSIEEYVESSGLSSDLKEAYLVIIKIVRNESEYYAERLREAIAGLGTDDDTLISIIVLRSEIDLREVMDVYRNKFGVTLQEDVIGDTSGDYRHILLKILNMPGDEGEEIIGRKDSVVVVEGEGKKETELVEIERRVSVVEGKEEIIMERRESVMKADVGGKEEEEDEKTITPQVDEQEDAEVAAVVVEEMTLLEGESSGDILEGEGKEGKQGEEVKVEQVVVDEKKSDEIKEVVMEMEENAANVVEVVEGSVEVDSSGEGEIKMEPDQESISKANISTEKISSEGKPEAEQPGNLQQEDGVVTGG